MGECFSIPRAWGLLLVFGLGTTQALIAQTANAESEDSRCSRAIFEEVAQLRGIDFVHDRGATENRHNPETMGSGVGWLDYDNDGWWDLYVVQSGVFPPDGGERSANRLYRNVEGVRFEDVTALSESGDRGYGQGVVAADYDGDGDVDLYLTNYGADRLLVNRGDGRFEDQTSDAALGLEGWSSSAAFADADRDGDLDLFVTRYVVHDAEQEPFCAHPETGERDYCDPGVFEAIDDRFFLNVDGVRFEDATAAAKLTGSVGKGLGVLFVDLNADLWPDLYVANDMTINFLFVNRADGTFEDQSLLSGSAVSREGALEAGMGVAVGDVDEDGDADLTVTNYDVQTNTLYLNRGDFQFEDVSAQSGFGLPSFNMVGFGTALSDFDVDGHLDAYVTNGHTTENPFRDNVSYDQPDILLLGDGSGRFVAACPVAGQNANVGRGLAVADFDNDGSPDIAVQRSGRQLSLLHNASEPGAWLGVRLSSRSSGTEGIGAVVRLRTQSRSQTRWVIAGDSYQSSSDRRIVFGIDPGDEVVELEIQWQSGTRQKIRRPAINRHLNVVESAKKAG